MSKINNTFKNINASIFSALKESVNETNVYKNSSKTKSNKNLNETGEWDDENDEMTLWLEDLKGQAQELASQINGEVKVVKGFDKYQGPFAIVHSPKHGDVEMWYDQEDDTGRSFSIKVSHVGWITGGINQLANLLNQDTIPENEILSESSLKEWKDGETISQYAITFYLNSNLTSEELEAKVQELLSNLENDETIKRPIKDLKIQQIAEIHERLPESSLKEERINMMLHKGDTFMNDAGVKVVIADVDNEHLLDGEPQVTFYFTNYGVKSPEDYKCFKMSSVIGMLNQSGYRKEI